MKKIALLILLISQLSIISATEQDDELVEEYVVVPDFNKILGPDQVPAPITSVGPIRQFLNKFIARYQQPKLNAPKGSIQQLLDTGRITHVLDGRLDLRYLEITSLIGLNNIPSIETVNHLNLSHNKLENIIELEAFNLPQLIELNVSYNQLKRIESEVFSNLPHIRVLHCSYNQLKKIKQGIFKNLPDLVAVHLDNNQLETIESKAFFALPYLRVLNFSHNQLETIEPEVFVALPYLKVLDLSYNQLRQIEPKEFNLYLERLNLSHNRLITIELKDFNLLNLEVLNLSYNRLKTIEPKYSKLPGIKELDCTNNCLTEDNVKKIKDYYKNNILIKVFLENQTPHPTGDHTKAALRNPRPLDSIYLIPDQVAEVE